MREENSMRGQMNPNANVTILVEPEQEPEWMTNIKLTLLILFTFGLIVGMYALSGAIERMKGTLVKSYTPAGGLLLGLFIFYLICFGTAWYFGAQKRDTMRLEAVEKQLNKERALQSLMNME